MSPPPPQGPRLSLGGGGGGAHYPRRAVGLVAAAATETHPRRVPVGLLDAPSRSARAPSTRSLAPPSPKSAAPWRWRWRLWRRWEPACGNRYQQVSSAQMPPHPRPRSGPALAALGPLSGPACSQLDVAACQAALGLGRPGGPRARIRRRPRAGTVPPRRAGVGRWKNLRPAVFAAFPTAGGVAAQKPRLSGGFDLRAPSLPFSTLNLMSLEKGGGDQNQTKNEMEGN